MTDRRRPTHVPGIDLQMSGNELLVHDTLHAKVHVLNATAGRIFGLCDGVRSVDNIVDAVIAEWGIDETTARRDVGRALSDFVSLGILALPADAPA